MCTARARFTCPPSLPASPPLSASRACAPHRSTAGGDLLLHAGNGGKVGYRQRNGTIFFDDLGRHLITQGSSNCHQRIPCLPCVRRFTIGRCTQLAPTRQPKIRWSTLCYLSTSTNLVSMLNQHVCTPCRNVITGCHRQHPGPMPVKGRCCRIRRSSAFFLFCICSHKLRGHDHRDNFGQLLSPHQSALAPLCYCKSSLLIWMILVEIRLYERVAVALTPQGSCAQSVPGSQWSGTPGSSALRRRRRTPLPGESVPSSR